MGLVIAGSPVELEAEADEGQLTPDGRVAALALFHSLTSRLELGLLTTQAEGGEPWPRHRFWFGSAEEVQPLVSRLRALPGAAEAPAAGSVVFLTGEHGDWRAVMAAGSGPGWADGIV